MTDLGSVGISQRSAGITNIQTSHTVGQQKPGALFHLAKTANQVSLVSLVKSVDVYYCQIWQLYGFNLVHMWVGRHLENRGYIINVSLFRILGAWKRKEEKKKKKEKITQYLATYVLARLSYYILLYHRN